MSGMEIYVVSRNFHGQNVLCGNYWLSFLELGISEKEPIMHWSNQSLLKVVCVETLRFLKRSVPH
jgi:hypothetical protein